jgi:hypothetical protein
MKLSSMWLTGLCLAALAFTGSAKAQNTAQSAEYTKLPDKDKAIYRHAMYLGCIVQLVNTLAQDDDFGRARSMKTHCACKVNRAIQGLMMEDCPKINAIGGEEARKTFSF